MNNNLKMTFDLLQLFQSKTNYLFCHIFYKIIQFLRIVGMKETINGIQFKYKMSYYPF